MTTFKHGPESTYTAAQIVVRSLEDRLELITNDNFVFVGLSLNIGKG